MEVVKPSSPIPSFDFNSAPPSPSRFGECFFSAPTTPSRISEFYSEFDRLSIMNHNQTSSSSAIPFDWEEKPKSVGKTKIHDDDEENFAFDFRQPLLEKTYQLSAEELFDGGKIKPFKPPQVVDKYDKKSPFLSSQGKKIVHAFSPSKKTNTEDGRGRGRGRERERAHDMLSKNSSRRATRSLSPYRVSDEEDENDQISSNIKQSSSKGSSSRKWRSLRDLLLFRSASEGHNRDTFRKYSSSFIRKSEDHHHKSSSFKSVDSSGSARSKRKVSAHELHYTTNKAASDNMKKKTFLPYKQGILGRLAFIPAVGTPAKSYNNTM
ncbi:hypothetical protein Gohar_017040 [Gossypium harknessii]|uniref:Uncharacterized protein n=1 Tax=Gossypium harknessii TaxID=34285 RepID=A0A7J9G4L3_9ROSI|nr:hypothetical protein [Gossypium harknessii]